MNTRTHAHESPEATAAVPARDDDEALRTLWRRWASGRAAADRERLILCYAPLVKYVAGRLSVGISAAVETGDLISYGIIGLIDAIERFDPQRGVRFESYAIERIKGAIIDELRAVDWVPRRVREHARAVQTAVAELEAELQRTPTDEELAAHLGVSAERLAEMLGEVSLTSLVALDELFVDGRSGPRELADTLQDPHAVDPQRRLERRELRATLADAIDRLPERERTVVVLYYLEGLTLAQIGRVLSVSESRASQLHTKAVLSLRAKLRAAAGAPVR